MIEQIKRFFADLVSLFFLCVGISGTRTKQKKLDLRKLVSDANRGLGDRKYGERWILVNRVASSVEFSNREAVAFDARSVEGLAWIDGLRFSTGKIDLTIAAVKQDVGVIFHLKNENDFEAVCFHIDSEAQNESEIQGVIVEYTSTNLGRSESKKSQFSLPYARSGEWFKARIAISKRLIAVFTDGANLPTLSVYASEFGKDYESSGDSANGSIGLWVGPGSSALVTDFRMHVVRSDIENQIRGIFGRSSRLR